MNNSAARPVTADDIDFNSLPVEEPTAITPADAADASQVGSLFSFREIELTWIIFIFGLIALTVFYLLVRNQRAAVHTIRMYVIVILVFGTLLVVSSAYTTTQIAPVVGFFGTIAGYLLGRSERPGGKDDDTP